MIQDFLTIHSLKDYKPDLSSPAPFGFVDPGKGGTYFLNQDPSYSLVVLVEFSPEKGPRGNHVHLEKKEIFYMRPMSIWTKLQLVLKQKV